MAARLAKVPVGRYTPAPVTPPPGSDAPGALRREILHLAWPVVLQNLSRTMMFLVDTFMIGRLGPEAMAAAGIAGPVFHTVTGVLGAVGVAATAVVARAWGEGDRGKQEREAAAALAAAALAGIPLSAAGAWLLPAAAGLFPVPGSPAVGGMAAGFLFWSGLSLFFFALDSAAAGVLRAAGRTRLPMAAALAGNVLNVLLNWIFIYGNLGAPAMGVAGAGLATAASLALQASIETVALALPGSPVRLRPASFRGMTRAALSRFARVALPAAVEPLVLQSGWLVYTRAVTLLGAIPLAAHRAAVTVEALTYMPGYAFAVAGSALVGQALGAGRPDRAEAVIRETSRLATVLMSAIGVVFLVFPAPLVRLFVPEAEEVVGLAALCLAISAFEQPFMATAMALGGGLRGAGDTRSPVAATVVGVWLVRVPLSWALAFPAGLGLTGIWITMIADWAVRTLYFKVLCRRGAWKRLAL